MICEHCNKECKTSSSYKNHTRRCPKNANRIIEPKTAAGRKRISQAAKQQNATQWTTEFKERHSVAMRKAVVENPDSYTKNNVSGRTKIIKYNGVKLKGSWEVKVAKWLTSQGILWETEINPQPYYWNDKWHLYFPDFYIEKHNIYIEVKGYKTDRDEAKWRHFNGTLIIIDLGVIHSLEKYNLDKLYKHQFNKPL